MKLIVGLGNPGKEYSKTRHNVGFMIVDDFVAREKIGKRTYENKRSGEVIASNIAHQKVIFLKPMEFMNLSGGAISLVANFYKIEVKNILIIHDDIDLPVGKVQLKLGGSSAGHNGLKSTIEKLGSKDFWRLRIGVDRPINQSHVADYVLTSFKKEEKNLIDDKMNDVETHITTFLSA